MEPKTHLFLTLALFAGMAGASAGSPATRSNVVVVYTDDHGYADLGCMGIKPDVKTPNIDALAANGVRFTSGYVTAPQCGPSRAGLISGQYQQRFGMEANGAFETNPDVLQRFRALKTLPKRLKEAGYVTGMAGKSHLGSNDSAELVKLGFDKSFFKHSAAPGHWNMDLEGRDLPPQVQKGGEYHLEQIATFACVFIERFRSQPFFFYLAFRGPHVPLDAPKKYLDRFPGTMPENRRKALGAIAAIDDGVGRVTATLRRHGLEENTLIFVIGDNGAPLKITKADGPGSAWDGSLNDPLKGEKGMLTEGGIRVPWVCSWKGTIPGGQVYHQPVITLDVAATAVALAGLPAAPALDGVNLKPYLTGENKAAPHEVLYWRWVGQFAIRQGDWKYLASGDREYLFNLAADPGENNNLLPQRPDLGRQLRTRLMDWSQGLIPAGLVPTEMTRPAQMYYDHYLDGKPLTGPRGADTAGDNARKARERGKAAKRRGGANE